MGNVASWLLLQHASAETTSQSAYPYGPHSDGVDVTSYTIQHAGPHVAVYTVRRHIQSATTQRIPLCHLCRPTTHCSGRPWSILRLDPTDQKSCLSTWISRPSCLHRPQLRSINSDAVDLFPQLSRRTSPVPIPLNHLPNHLGPYRHRPLRDDFSPHGRPLLHDRRNPLPRTPLPECAPLQTPRHQQPHRPNLLR